MMPFHFVLAATSSTTAASTKSSGGSPATLIFLVLIVVALYFFFLRPRQQRMRRQQTQAQNLALGDEVQTIGGIRGVVVGFDGDDIEVEVSSGVVMTFVRRAVHARQQPAGAARGAQDAAGADDAGDEWPAEPAETNGTGSFPAAAGEAAEGDNTEPPGGYGTGTEGDR